jgi:hypothetical protein
MNPALILAAVATVGWNGAELRRIEPNDLLAAAFVARLTIDANRAIGSVTPEAVALEFWYPPVPATEIIGVAGSSPIDPHRDVRYDLALPFFRTKP